MASPESWRFFVAALQQRQQPDAQRPVRGDEGGGFVKLPEAGQVDLVHHRRVGQFRRQERMKPAQFQHRFKPGDQDLKLATGGGGVPGGQAGEGLGQVQAMLVAPGGQEGGVFPV